MIALRTGWTYADIDAMTYHRVCSFLEEAWPDDKAGKAGLPKLPPGQEWMSAEQALARGLPFLTP